MRFPKLVIALMRKALREGKVMIDWSQNDENKTTVAPYSLRGRDTARNASKRTRSLWLPRGRKA